MSEKFTKRRIVELAEKLNLDPSTDLTSKIEEDAETYSVMSRRTRNSNKEDNPMKKRILISAGAACALLVMGVCLVLFFGNNNKAYADYYSYEQFDLNMTAEVSAEFIENQNRANKMFSQFVMEKLPYQGKYKAPAATGEYTVDGNRADAYPDYFGGTYINVDGKLIVTIKDTYFEKRYREADWYKELAKMLGSEDFACRPVKYNYTELVNGMSDMAFGSLGKAIKEAGVEVVGFGVNDYSNGIVIDVKTEEDAAIVKSIATSDMFITAVVGDVEITDDCLKDTH